MSQRESDEWMWQRAADLLERADKVQRRFFHLARTGARPCWEPPIDVFEGEEELAILVALPGVAVEDVEVQLGDGEIVVVARRQLPAEFARGLMRRLEIPAGRFERRIVLPPGSYALYERVLCDGCLVLRLRKV